MDLPQIRRDTTPRPNNQRLRRALGLILPRASVRLYAHMPRLRSLPHLITHPNPLRAQISQKVNDKRAHELRYIRSLPLTAPKALDRPCQGAEALPDRDVGDGGWEGDG